MQTMAPNWLPDSMYVAKFMLTTHGRSDLEHLRDRCGCALAIRDGLKALGIGLRAIGLGFALCGVPWRIDAGGRIVYGRAVST